MKSTDTPTTHTAESSDSADQTERGRKAGRPGEIPMRGWRDVSWRAAKRFSDDNVTLIAGGLAMYALLSVFPALAATVSIYGLFATPADVVQQMSAFAGVLPPGAWDIFNTELQSITKTEQSTLTLAAVFGVVLALWSARAAMSSLMTATNIAYGEREKRGLIRTTLLSLAFTAGAILGFLLMLTLGVAIPLVLAAFGAADWTKVAVSILRGVLLWIIMIAGFAVVYRYAPARRHAQWRWVFPGSVIAATLWLTASALFAFYVTNFAGYTRTYGTLGGVVALLMWFFVSSIVTVLGAQINAELERQTFKDTTVSRDAPMGQRNAFAADTVGPAVNSGKAPTENESALAFARVELSDIEYQGTLRPQFNRRIRTMNDTNSHVEHRPKSGPHAVSRAPFEPPAAALDAGALIEKAAKAVDPSRSRLGRMTAAVSAIRLAVRVLPTGVRWVRRHPFGSGLAIAAVIWAVVAARSQSEERLSR